MANRKGRIGGRIIAGADAGERVRQEHAPAGLHLRHTLDHRKILRRNRNRAGVEDRQVARDAGKPIGEHIRQQPSAAQRQRQRAQAQRRKRPAARARPERQRHAHHAAGRANPRAARERGG